MCLNTAGLVITLTLVALTLPSGHCKKNRTDLMYCLHCKGPDDFCLSTNATLQAENKLELCAKPIQQCYTMMQTDGVRTIITRGCAHTRFCQFTRRVHLYDLKYCKQCIVDSETNTPCNSEDSFNETEPVYDDDSGTNRSGTDLRLTLGMLILLIMTLTG
uniref:Uncharacterized protein n=1 Tax=Cacopsylla melanoneura TaxID=428564 RepID=A0A8D8RWH0_9HEMI